MSCPVYIGVSYMEIKTEINSDHITDCSHDDMPSTGMFAVSDDIYCAVSFPHCCCVHFVT